MYPELSSGEESSPSPMRGGKGAAYPDGQMRGRRQRHDPLSSGGSREDDEGSSSSNPDSDSDVLGPVRRQGVTFKKEPAVHDRQEATGRRSVVTFKQESGTSKSIQVKVMGHNPGVAAQHFVPTGKRSYESPTAAYTWIIDVPYHLVDDVPGFVNHMNEEIAKRSTAAVSGGEVHLQLPPTTYVRYREAPEGKGRGTLVHINANTPLETLREEIALMEFDGEEAYELNAIWPGKREVTNQLKAGARVRRPSAEAGPPIKQAKVSHNGSIFKVIFRWGFNGANSSFTSPKLEMFLDAQDCFKVADPEDVTLAQLLKEVELDAADCIDTSNPMKKEGVVGMIPLGGKLSAGYCQVYGRDQLDQVKLAVHRPVNDFPWVCVVFELATSCTPATRKVEDLDMPKGDQLEAFRKSMTGGDRKKPSKASKQAIQKANELELSVNRARMLQEASRDDTVGNKMVAGWPAQPRTSGQQLIMPCAQNWAEALAAADKAGNKALRDPLAPGSVPGAIELHPDVATWGRSAFPSPLQLVGTNAGGRKVWEDPPGRGAPAPEVQFYEEFEALQDFDAAKDPELRHCATEFLVLSKGMKVHVMGKTGDGYLEATTADGATPGLVVPAVVCRLPPRKRPPASAVAQGQGQRRPSCASLSVAQSAPAAAEEARTTPPPRRVSTLLPAPAADAEIYRFHKRFYKKKLWDALLDMPVGTQVEDLGDWPDAPGYKRVRVISLPEGGESTSVMVGDEGPVSLDMRYAEKVVPISKPPPVELLFTPSPPPGDGSATEKGADGKE